MRGVLALSAQNSEHVYGAGVEGSYSHFPRVFVRPIPAAGGCHPEDVPAFDDEALQGLGRGGRVCWREGGKEGWREGGKDLGFANQ